MEGIIGKKVVHQKWGEGKIVAVEEKKIKVKFPSCKVDFQFPAAFSNYLKALDPGLQNLIEKMVKEDLKPNTLKPLKKRNVYYVFQGKTFDEECKGGFIWAPKKNCWGQRFDFWDRMQKVKKGDIIFHARNRFIVAISEAQEDCYDCMQPEELKTTREWLDDGYRVDCKYDKLVNAVSTKQFVDEILQYGTSPTNPFNGQGMGKQGYLYCLGEELTQIFLRSILYHNPYLKKLTYVKDLLEE